MTVVPKIDGKLTIDKAMETLALMREHLGGDAPVQLMTHREAPRVSEVIGIVSLLQLRTAMPRNGDDIFDANAVFFVASGRAQDFYTKRAWDYLDLPADQQKLPELSMPENTETAAPQIAAPDA